MTARAAPPVFPLPGHRTMAEVMLDEYNRRPRDEKTLSRSDYEKRAA